MKKVSLAISILVLLCGYGCDDNDVSNEQLTCMSDLDCANNSSGKTKCDLTNNVCVTPDPVTQPGCHSDLDCANNSSGKTKCDLTNNVCVTPDPVTQPGCH